MSRKVIAMLIMVLAYVGNVKAQKPMICRTGHTVANFEIPKAPECVLPDTLAAHNPVNITFTLFKPNLVQYKNKAYHCKIVKTEIITLRIFW